MSADSPEKTIISAQALLDSVRFNDDGLVPG